MKRGIPTYLVGASFETASREAQGSFSLAMQLRINLNFSRSCVLELRASTTNLAFLIGKSMLCKIMISLAS